MRCKTEPIFTTFAYRVLQKGADIKPQTQNKLVQL